MDEKTYTCPHCLETISGTDKYYCSCFKTKVVVTKHSVIIEDIFLKIQKIIDK
jgi:hypothetical protein